MIAARGPAPRRGALLPARTLTRSLPRKPAVWPVSTSPGATQLMRRPRGA
jgi:hypothetical protein